MVEPCDTLPIHTPPLPVVGPRTIMYRFSVVDVGWLCGLAGVQEQPGGIIFVHVAAGGQRAGAGDRWR